MLTEEEVIFGTLVVSLTLIFIAATLFVFYTYYRRRQFQYLREKDALQLRQQHLQTEIELQERTFQVISQEIHDNIGQLLSLAKLNLSTANINDPACLAEKIEHSKELIANSIAALRDLSKSLNAELIKEIGISKAIQRELSLLSKSGAYTTSFTENGHSFRTNQQKELVLFRIFQETLNNIIKHSNARSVNVQLNYQPASLELLIADDGVGFSVQDEGLSGGNGLGIRNMQNRANLIGAVLKFNSGMGQGTAVSIVLPAEKNSITT